MSQSKPAYGAERPKGIAYEHRHQPEKTDDTPEAVTEPACWRHSASDWEWHEVPYTAAYAAIHEPCSDCFSDKPPAVSTLETVVRSCSYPVKYHRPRDADETDSSDTSRETNGGKSENNPQPGNEATDASVSVNSITELQKGDGVLWQNQSTPLVVAEPATTPDGTVALVGPNGGEYRIEGRPTATRSHAIYPAVGVVEGLCRVVPANDHPRPEAV